MIHCQWFFSATWPKFDLLALCAGEQLVCWNLLIVSVRNLQERHMQGCVVFNFAYTHMVAALETDFCDSVYVKGMTNLACCFNFVFRPLRYIHLKKLQIVALFSICICPGRSKYCVLK
jgi:hypothetical protein